MASILDLLRRLVDAHACFVLVGGMAGAAHGSSIVTEDVDVCVPFDEENIGRVLDALRGLNPKMRMRPDRPPVPDDVSQLRGLRNLYVVCDAGQIDLLGEITGVGGYDLVMRGAITLDLGGFECRVMGLEDLIRSKRALGRPKDLRAAAELEIVLQRSRGAGRK
jgi:hypothetical protein